MHMEWNAARGKNPEQGTCLKETGRKRGDATA